MITFALPAAEALPQRLHEFAPVRRSPDSATRALDSAGGRFEGDPFLRAPQLFQGLGLTFLQRDSAALGRAPAGGLQIRRRFRQWREGRVNTAFAIGRFSDRWLTILM